MIIEQDKQDIRHDIWLAEDYFILSGMRFNSKLLAEVLAHKYRSGDYINARVPAFVRWRERLPFRLRAFTRLTNIKKNKDETKMQCL
jgi:hypothetical protein